MAARSSCPFVSTLQRCRRPASLPVRVDFATMPAAVQDILWLDATSDQIELVADRLLGSSGPRARRTIASLRDAVVRSLATLPVEWVADPALGGVRADFLVT